MRTLRRLRAPLALLLLAGSATAARPASLHAAPAAEGADLVVNGETIPEAAVRREIVYRHGQRELGARRLDILIAKELERRGLEADELVTDEEVREVVDRQLARLDEEYRGELDAEQVLKNNKLTEETLVEQARGTLLFNRIFLPENPSEWPEITREALAATMPEEQRQMFFERMQEGYEKRVASGEELDPNDPQRLIFNQMLRQPILGVLDDRADVKTAVDGLPADVAMVVHGEEIPTGEVFAEIEERLTPIEWERTRLWLAKTTAVRQDLEEKGFWLSDEEFEEVWGELEDRYSESLIPLEQLALAIKKFPSVDAYRRYRRGLESFHDMIADEITDEVLAEHVEHANRVYGLEKVEAEVILLSAYDFLEAEWKENGWEEAKRRATEVSRKLAAGEDWDALLEEYSDFWDPPVPTSQQGNARNQASKRNQGRFGLQNRNSLMPLLDESQYLSFVFGSSVADHVFFDQEAGTFAGPFKGPYGYYLTHVVRRVPGKRAYDLSNPDHREGVTQDYVRARYHQYAAEVLAEADVQGL